MEKPEIAGYQFKRVVGHGRHGTVWLAEGVDHREVALKVFNAEADLAALRQYGRRVGLEPVRNGSALVVHQELEKRPCFEVLEFLGDDSGLTLSLEDQRGLMREDPERIWEFLENFLKALAWMHRHPLAHGNLKPSNIFIAPDGGVRLTDAALNGIGDDGICSDGLFYMPPDQLRHADGFVAGKAYAWDVYAFGVEAYYLLTGNFPRLGSTFRSALEMGDDHLLEIEADPVKLAAELEAFEAPQFPSGLQGSRERLRLILDCLELQSEKRPANANELLARWEQCVPTIGREAQGLNPHTEERPYWKRRSILVFGLALVCVIFAMLGWSGEVEFNKRLQAEKAELLTRVRDQAAFKREAEAARVARTRAEDRLLELSDLTRLAVQQSWGFEAGSSEFLSPSARRAHLRQRLESFLDRLPSKKDNQWIRRRVGLALAELDWHEARWEEASIGLRNALRTPDLFEGREIDRVVPERQLALALLELDDRVGARQALTRARVALAKADASSEWYADQLGQIEMVAARIAQASDDAEGALEHTRAALNAFTDAPAGPDSLVYFRGQYLEIVDHYANQLEAQGALENLDELRRQATKVLREALAEDSDGALLYRLARTRLGLVRGRLREGDLEGFESELAELDELLDDLGGLSAYVDHTALIGAERRILQAQDFADLGRRADVEKALKEARERLDQVKLSALELDRDFLQIRLEWAEAWMLKGTPKSEDICDLAKRLESLEEGSSGAHQRKLTAYRAQLLSDGASLLSADSAGEALKLAAEAVGLWRELVKSYPNNSDYRAMYQFTQETVERLRPED